VRRGVAVLVAVAALAGCGSDDAVSADGVRVERITVDSAAVGRRLPVSVVVPAGGRRRPLLVFLHGRGNDERTYLNEHMLSALARLGPQAPIVAFPSSSEGSYWHDRREGAWGRFVTDEVIPAVTRRFEADRRRIAIGGISMGGFGAYDIARLHPRRFCAAGGHSPAVWQSGGETAPGAFDDADDFARHDLIAAARSDEFGALRLWLDAGDADPFRPGHAALVSALRDAGARVTAKSWPGGHDGDYWNAHWLDYLRFYAGALRRCNR
jgi:S-formylglutathione hydrolase FrmB